MDEKEGPKFLGRDVSKIPCFRNTFLYSLSSGLGVGLIYFMFTSKVQQSYRFGFAAYVITTMGYWSHCRYKFAQQSSQMEEINKFIRGEKNIEVDDA
ncbi:UNVERIFIED_CONTAM: hypothetical protein RMT77_000457 [Armadillidium vulgare]